jgi:hypothetical protein
MLSEHHVHKFFHFACRAAKKYEESHLARQAVKDHIKGFKDVAATKDAKFIERSLIELEGKVMDAMDKQSKVIKHVHEEESFNHQLLHRIASIEKHLERYMNHQEKRAERIKKIEERMKQKKDDKIAVKQDKEEKKADDKIKKKKKKKT